MPVLPSFRTLLPCAGAWAEDIPRFPREGGQDSALFTERSLLPGERINRQGGWEVPLDTAPAVQSGCIYSMYNK